MAGLTPPEGPFCFKRQLKRKGAAPVKGRPKEMKKEKSIPKWMRIVASIGPPELFELRRRRQAPASSPDIVEWLTA